VKSIPPHRSARLLPQRSGFGWKYLATLLFIISGAEVGRGSELCVECIELKLEHPLVLRGPSSHDPDAPISIIKLSDGAFRGFAANGVTVAIDGATPLDLKGPARVVLKPGPLGSPSECGRWLTSLLPVGGDLYGLIHDEQHCNYSVGETHKSMSIAISHDDGLIWNDLGPIITDSQGDISGKPSGVGDCTAVDGHDGYWYAYCLRPRDWKHIVARAPHDAPTPGKWVEWDGNDWHEPALGGAAAPLGEPIGTSAAYWIEAGDVLLLNAASSSLQLSVSKDKVNFETVSEPLILYNANDWKRPAPTDLYAYPAMIADGGLNNISHRFFLAYMYIPPGQDFTRRYLVMQEGRIDLSPVPRRPQVRTALTRWVTPQGFTWTTTGPAISPGHFYAYDRSLGYMMTATPDDAAALEVDECFSPQTGIGFLAKAGDCAGEGSARRRTAGYIFRNRRPGTVTLVDCAKKNGERFVSDRLDCENAGTRKRLLGFALQ
jgi:hypothetical protein